MGQKVNPVSMRLQVNKDWRSKWFVDKRDYAKFLEDDLAVRRLISKKLGSRAAINNKGINKVGMDSSHLMANRHIPIANLPWVTLAHLGLAQ